MKVLKIKIWKVTGFNQNVIIMLFGDVLKYNISYIILVNTVIWYNVKVILNIIIVVKKISQVITY